MTATHPAFWQHTYEEHGSAVMAFLASRTGRRDLAEDLLQETFVRAIRAGGSLRDTSKVRSYLLSTAHRLVLNHVRRKRPKLFSEFSEDASQSLLDTEDYTAPSPEDAAGSRRLEERLAQAVAALSPPLRAAFRLAVLEQLSYVEIGSRQGWTPGQVRVNVHRARKKVMAALPELLETP